MEHDRYHTVYLCEHIRQLYCHRYECIRMYGYIGGDCSDCQCTDRVRQSICCANCVQL